MDATDAADAAHARTDAADAAHAMDSTDAVDAMDAVTNGTGLQRVQSQGTRPEAIKRAIIVFIRKTGAESEGQLRRLQILGGGWQARPRAMALCPCTRRGCQYGLSHCGFHSVGAVAGRFHLGRVPSAPPGLHDITSLRDSMSEKSNSEEKQLPSDFKDAMAGVGADGPRLRSCSAKLHNRGDAMFGPRPGHAPLPYRSGTAGRSPHGRHRQHT